MLAEKTLLAREAPAYAGPPCVLGYELFIGLWFLPDLHVVYLYHALAGDDIVYRGLLQAVGKATRRQGRTGAAVVAGRIVATQCQVEEDELIVAVDPLAAGGLDVRAQEGANKGRIDVPLDIGRIPLDPVVVPGGDCAPSGHVVLPANRAGAPVTGAVQRAGDPVGITDVLHDIGLTGARPADRIDVGAHHPERWPVTFAHRHLHAGKYFAELPVLQSLGEDAAGCELVTVIDFLLGGNVQEAAADGDVVGGIFLLLTIIMGIIVVGPVGGGQGRAVEVVGPYQRIGAGQWTGGGGLRGAGAIAADHL